MQMDVFFDRWRQHVLALLARNLRHSPQDLILFEVLLAQTVWEQL